MKFFSRRDILKATGAGIVAGAASLRLPFPALAEAAAQGGFLFTGGEINKDSQAMACRVALGDESLRLVSLDFHPHSFCPFPGETARAVAIEKWGEHAAVVDFDEQRVTGMITADPETNFYGHGVFTPKKDAIFITQFDRAKGKGHLVGYDAKTFRKVAQYDAAPAGLHECRMSTRNTFMAASMGVYQWKGQKYGKRVEQTSLVELDPESGKILNKNFVAGEERAMAHFSIAANGLIVAVTGPGKSGDHHGAIYLSHMDSKNFRKVSFTPENEENLGREMLSVAINDAGTAAGVTNPEGSAFLLVDIATAAVKVKIPIEGANGVIYDPARNAFIVSGRNGLTTVTADGFAQVLPLQQPRLLPAAGFSFHSTRV